MVVLGVVCVLGLVAVSWAARFFFAPLRWRSPLEQGPHMPTVDERAPLAPPYPSGWIPLAGAHELRPGEVRQIRALGRLWAVYRGESGKVAVTEAFCPHLGANLAAPELGASVVGDCLRCPFHGWQFDAIGRGGECTRIPYTEKLPVRSARARLATFPSREADGLLWVWHDAAGGAPTWELPEPSAAGRLDATWELELGASVQDIMENQADLAHAGILHLELLRDLPGWRIFSPWLHFIVFPNDVEVAPGDRLGLDWAARDRWPGPPAPKKRSDWRVLLRAADPRATDEDVRALRALHHTGTPLRDGLPLTGAHHPQEMTAAHVGALAFFGGRLWVHSFLVIRQVGPCLLKISMAIWLRGRWRRFPVTVRMAATPAAPGRATIRVAVEAERRGWPRFMSKIVLGMFYLLGMQDFRIWNSKSWRALPPFVEGDGRIPVFRKWYAQFTPGAEAERPLRVVDPAR